MTPEEVAATVEAELAAVGVVVLVPEPRETLSTWWARAYRGRFGVAAGLSPHDAGVLDGLEEELGGPEDAREILQRVLDSWDAVASTWGLEGRPGVGFLRAYRWAFPRITATEVLPLPRRGTAGTSTPKGLGEAPPESALRPLA